MGFGITVGNLYRLTEGFVMTDVERLQKMLPENICVGYVELDTSGNDVFVLIRGSWEAPIRELHNVVLDAVVRCFNLFAHTVGDRTCWRVGGVFEISIELVKGKPWTVET